LLPRGALPQTLTDPFFTARWARALRRRDFDLLLAHQSATAAGLWAARLDVPLTLIFHASVPRELRFVRSHLPLGPKRLTTYLLEPPLVLYERIAVRRAAGILILSEFSRSLLESDHSEVAGRAVRVPGGIDTEAFSPGDAGGELRARLGLDSDAPLLLTVRRLEPRMGLDTLLRALGHLLETRKVVLALAGVGSIEGSLRQLSEDLGLGSHLRFLGRVSDQELLDLYRSADLFVLPTVAYEGFGMVTAEALACGTPVVGTPVGATPELLRPLEPRLVAQGADVEPLAAAIADALELVGPDFRRRCREYACARFSWDAAIPVWEEALEQVAGRTADGKRR
jgi:glycosyltransferase involved in cell wall biosynthesis